MKDLKIKIVLSIALIIAGIVLNNYVTVSEDIKHYTGLFALVVVYSPEADPSNGVYVDPQNGGKLTP